MPIEVLQAGRRLRLIRDTLGLTLRDVEAVSARLVEKYGSEDFLIALSRLSDIETKGVVPSIYRMYTLAIAYRLDYRELLAWYGIDLNNVIADLALVEPPKTHRLQTMQASSAVRVPVRLDPAFDLRRTVNLGRMIERWGLVPLSFLAQFENTDYSYGYVGSEDFTMYPILPPGSLVQIDESRNVVTEGVWRSEFERPIYLVETRTGYVCSWCAVKDGNLVLHSHPMSPQPVRVLPYPQDAEVVGQVIGVAMRLADFQPAPVNPEPARLN